MSQPLSFLGAAEKILEEAGEPLHEREIAARALDERWSVTRGKTPYHSLTAQISVDLKVRGRRSAFVRVGPGIFGLRRWTGEPEAESMLIGLPSLVPDLPSYESVRDVMSVWKGAPEQEIQDFQMAIGLLTGTSEHPVMWQEVETWIDQHLTGKVKEWAQRTWKSTDGRVNPRDSPALWHLIRRARLFEASAGCLEVTEIGQDFLQQDSATLAHIDFDQGVLRTLRTLAEAGASTLDGLRRAWNAFISAEASQGAGEAGEPRLSSRLSHLLERQLVERTGRIYRVTAAGLRWLQEASDEVLEHQPEEDLIAEIRRLQEAIRQRVRGDLLDLLDGMDPFVMERWMLRLLAAMGYQHLESLTPSKESGIDLVGSLKVGIREVLEVVRVDRSRKPLDRGALDQLRGSLYRYGAAQAMLITPQGFTEAARQAAVDQGAARITLIDGRTLVDLLIDHGIGVEKRNIELWSFDPAALGASTGDGTRD